MPALACLPACLEASLNCCVLELDVTGAGDSQGAGFKDGVLCTYIAVLRPINLFKEKSAVQPTHGPSSVKLNAPTRNGLGPAVGREVLR